MKKLIALILLLGFQLIQPQNFSVQAYKEFLQAHQNLTPSQLLEIYPAGLFTANLGLNPNDVLFLDSIRLKYNLTAYEESLLAQHGFVVSERLHKKAFGESFLEIYHNDLPVYITADALLHAFHISYDRILKEIEYYDLFDRTKLLLSKLHGKMNELHARYAATPEMLVMLKDADVYLTVARKLAGVSVQPYYPSNAGWVDTLVDLVNGYQPAGINLFSDQPRIVDFSQFKPRGHYIPDQIMPDIDKYFKTMMWMGRIELYLITPQNTLNPVKLYNVQRQVIQSYLITELMQLANGNSDYEYIEDKIKFFVGDQDNVSYSHLLELKNSVPVGLASEFLDTNKVKQFQDSLKTKEYAYQMILSQILYANAMEPDSIVPASAFLMFGQRFVVDSYVTGSVVFDRIPGNVCRLYPSVLDPMFALGNDAAAQLLLPELNQYGYSLNLAGLRYLIDSYGEDFWQSSMYNNWLAAIRTLKRGEPNEHLPDFMNTAAYWQRTLNSQLTSWTQLRHDNLLYAKQSYTGGSICSYPYAYLEPFPELYARLRKIGEIGKAKFTNLPGVYAYFSTLFNVSDSLTNIATKEINGEALTPDEINWMKRMIYSVDPGSGGSPFDGWYARLYYNDEIYDYNKGLMQNDFLVADIHTVPTDCGGTPLGGIVHVGTGPINLGVFLIKQNNQWVAYLGPNYSFYQYNTLQYLRLDDDQWKNTYLWSAARPDWVNLYLADSTGNTRGEGPSFLTDVKEPKDISSPVNFLTASNYPNPFNPSTVIRFTIPSALAFGNFSLIIYDVLGREVKQLYTGVLPASTYLVEWDGKDKSGQFCASGTYLYRLSSGEHQVSGKLMLTK